MGAHCSCLLARRSPRRSPSSRCPRIRRWLRPAAAAASPEDGTKGRQDAVVGAGGHGNALGVVVMPLQNPPDVIEAHQRYFNFSYSDPGRRAAAPPGPAARNNPVPIKYSYFTPSLATDTTRPRVARPRRPALDSAAAREEHGADSSADLPRDRTLPTQHQHPSPGSPRYPRRWSSTAASEEVDERPRCRRQAHGADRSHDHGARPRPARTTRASRCSGRPASRTCRASRTARAHNGKGPPGSRGSFGYDIQDVDSFLAKASLEKPANIPMVLACPSTLYQTEEGGWQQEVPLPLGMVLNGVFRVVEPSASSSSSTCWLYAQTPHGHEGYVRYASCLPLGILAATKTAPAAAAAPARSASPSPSSAASSETLPLSAHRPNHLHQHRAARPLSTPSSSWSRARGRGWGLSWDTASDIFPATLAALAGNQTDTDKAKDTRSERGYNLSRGARTSRRLQFQQGLTEARRAERSVDELYLRSIRSGATPTYAGGSMYFPSGVNL